MAANAATATTASTSVLAVRPTERLPRRRVRLIPGPSRGRFPLRVPPVRQSLPAWPDDRTHGRRAVGILGEIATDRYRHHASAPPAIGGVRIRDARSSRPAPADNPQHERAVAEAQYRKRRADLFEQHENRLRIRIASLYEPTLGHRLVDPERPCRCSRARVLSREQPPSGGSEVRARPRAKPKRRGPERRRSAGMLAPVRDVGPVVSKRAPTRSAYDELDDIPRPHPPVATAVCRTLSPGPAPSLRPDRRQRTLRRREVEAGARRASRASRRSAAARHRNGVRPCPPTFPKRTAAPSRR